MSKVLKLFPQNIAPKTNYTFDQDTVKISKLTNLAVFVPPELLVECDMDLLPILTAATSSYIIINHSFFISLSFTNKNFPMEYLKKFYKL